MKYFSEENDPRLFECGCGECDSQPTQDLLGMLDVARNFAGVPFVVTSGPRCAEYNATLPNHSPTSEHIAGDAADIEAQGSTMRMAIIYGATLAGFTRIGIGPGFIHLGVSKEKDQNVLWLY